MRIATRQALNRIRSNQARRETYIGPWLPEPLIASVVPDPADEVADRAEPDETISMAMLVVLETLSPAERAVLVLREVFGMTHDEVGAALDRTPASVRHLALTGLLAPDVTVLSDGGGKARAARRELVGADKAARLMIGVAHEAAQLSMRFVRVSGTLGVVGYDQDTAATVALLDLVDGPIAHIFIVANPDKLSHVAVIDPPETAT